MHSYCVTEAGQPLQLRETATPEPQGSEVLVKVSRCGVCHSDLHLWDGYYDLGGGNTLSVADRGITPPYTMGHEILGTIISAGPDAGDVQLDQTRLVYPWIGCGSCPVCQESRENLCPTPGFLGIHKPGGYGDHVLVPHPRYLVDINGIDPALAATYACSGVTAYSALKKAQPMAEHDHLVLIGAGGVGLTALCIAQAMAFSHITMVDIDDDKLITASKLGAHHILNSRAADALEELHKITDGGAAAVVDFVGASTTARLGIDALRKGGRYIIVGLFGGDITLSLPPLPMMARSVIGSYVGNLAELKELIELVKQGAITAIPVATRPAHEVNKTLEQLRDGEIVGRVVIDLDHMSSS